MMFQASELVDQSPVTVDMWRRRINELNGMNEY